MSNSRPIVAPTVRQYITRPGPRTVQPMHVRQTLTVDPTLGQTVEAVELWTELAIEPAPGTEHTLTATPTARRAR